MVHCVHFLFFGNLHTNSFFERRFRDASLTPTFRVDMPVSLFVLLEWVSLVNGCCG